jgi:hypothetical protein
MGHAMDWNWILNLFMLPLTSFSLPLQWAFCSIWIVDMIRHGIRLNFICKDDSESGLISRSCGIFFLLVTFIWLFTGSIHAAGA